ncbi:MAG: hypothetical protein QOF98_2712 [Streptomyces sp.]|nr:hypothetical protein [Streptomyces sp.]
MAMSISEVKVFGLPAPTRPRAARTTRPRPAPPQPSQPLPTAVTSAPIPTAPRRRWPGYALVACGLALLPWLVVLATGLPATASAPHWTIAWVGLDAMEAVGLITTGLLTLRRHPARSVAAAATAMLLLVDAWFDVTTSTGTEFAIALLMALLAELPLAAACGTLAVRAARPRNPQTA